MVVTQDKGAAAGSVPSPWGKGSLGLSPRLTERPGRCVSLGKGSVIYDSSFDLFKEIGHLCRLCKAIAGNSELVKPGGAQCLPSGMCGLGCGPCEVTAHLIAIDNMCLVFGCLYWSVPVRHTPVCPVQTFSKCAPTYRRMLWGVGGGAVSEMYSCASRGRSSRMEGKWLVQRLLDCSDPKCHFPSQWQVRVVGLSMTTARRLQTHWRRERQVSVCIQV